MLLFFSLFNPHEESAVGMWESRVLCEISKSLWKPFCGFHRASFPQPSFTVARDRADRGDAAPLPACRSPFLGPPMRSFSIRRPLDALRSGRSAASWPDTQGLLRHLLCAQVRVDLGAPAPWSAFEDVRMMEQPIEERGDSGGVAKQLSPVVDWPV